MQEEGEEGMDGRCREWMAPGGKLDAGGWREEKEVRQGKDEEQER